MKYVGNELLNSYKQNMTAAWYDLLDSTNRSYSTLKEGLNNVKPKICEFEQAKNNYSRLRDAKEWD